MKCLSFCLSVIVLFSFFTVHAAADYIQRDKEGSMTYLEYLEQVQNSEFEKAGGLP